MPVYCPDAGTSRGGNIVVCRQASSTVTNEPDRLCSRVDCELRKKNGVWICCQLHCRFGYKSTDRNRCRSCASCGHPVCEDCEPYYPEKTAELEADEVIDEGDGYPSSDNTNWGPVPDGRGGRSEAGDDP